MMDSETFAKENEKETANNVIADLFREYALNTTIHGFRYAAERKRHWTERIFWLLAIVLSFWLCGSAVITLYTKMSENPVIVSFAEKPTSIYDIPFPAVTICSETKANALKFNISDTIYKIKYAEKERPNFPEDIVNKAEAVAHICPIFTRADFNFTKNNSDNSVVDIMRDIAPSFNDSLVLCDWYEKRVDCENFFEEILTDEGVCFTFNSLTAKDLYTDAINENYTPVSNNSRAAKYWSLEKGYNNTALRNLTTFPYRMPKAGIRASLVVYLLLNGEHFEYYCRLINGFKVHLHAPTELPDMNKDIFRIPIDQNILVSVKPNMMTTSGELRRLSPKYRQCYFDSERQLKFFKVYTQRNCELECISNFTQQRCGCTKFCLPRDNVTEICGAAKIKCYVDAEDELLKQEFSEIVADSENVCNCLPECTSINYSAEISNTDVQWSDIQKAFNYTLKIPPGYHLSFLQIFFKEHQFIATKRSEFYALSDFIADFGGLLGLSMGISILSFYEIFYYCSLRFCFLVKWNETGRLLEKCCALVLIFTSSVFFVLFLVLLLIAYGYFDVNEVLFKIQNLF